MTNVKKRVLLVVPTLSQGGLEKVCVMTAKILSGYFDVIIAVLNGEEIIYDISGLTVVDLKLPSRRGIWGKFINVFLRAQKLKRIKKHYEIDISYGFGPTANISNVLGKKNDIIFSGLRSYLDLQNKKRMKFYCDKSDGIICCSAAIAKEVKEVYPNKPVYTLHNPYDIEQIEALSKEFMPAMPWKESEEFPKGKMIVSMGREDDVKGFWHLIKAFSLVKKAGHPVRLMIIGAGEFKEYMQLAEELGIGEDVFFAGVHQNPYPYLAEADIYVLSSLNEGFPNALVEAMALGIPIVAANCKTGPAEILLEKKEEVEITSYLDADFGILVPTLTGEKNMDSAVIEESDKILARAILTLIEDQNKYIHYRKQAKLRAKDFSNEVYLDRFVEIVRR